VAYSSSTVGTHWDITVYAGWGCSPFLVVPDPVISAIVPTMIASQRSASTGYRLGASGSLPCDLGVCPVLAEGPAGLRALSTMWHKSARDGRPPRASRNRIADSTNSQPDPRP
jgi:hypothetical protein